MRQNRKVTFGDNLGIEQIQFTLNFWFSRSSVVLVHKMILLHKRGRHHPPRNDYPCCFLCVKSDVFAPLKQSSLLYPIW